MTLEPLREALLSLAEADAGRALAEAEQRAASELSRSEHEAEALVAQARAEGDAAAEREAARTLGHAQAEARSRVLRARRDVYDELVARAHAAVSELRGDARYPELLERLEAAARSALGPEADVEVDPPGVGGVRARCGGRQVDYSLPALTESCLAGLGPRLSELWE